MKGLELEEEAEKTGLQEEAKMKVNKEFGGFQKPSKYPRCLSRPCGARRGELRLQAHRQWLAIKKTIAYSRNESQMVGKNTNTRP